MAGDATWHGTRVDDEDGDVVQDRVFVEPSLKFIPARGVSSVSVWGDLQVIGGASPRTGTGSKVYAYIIKILHNFEAPYLLHPASQVGHSFVVLHDPLAIDSVTTGVHFLSPTIELFCAAFGLKARECKR
jgi:hypothetical protein